MHYLDHAASSPLRPAAREAWLRAAEVAGNPSATHAAGRSARRILEESRELVAALLGADPAEVIFTSGGTEADNLALLGALRARDPHPHASRSDVSRHHPPHLNAPRPNPLAESASPPPLPDGAGPVPAEGSPSPPLPDGASRLPAEGAPHPPLPDGASRLSAEGAPHPPLPDGDGPVPALVTSAIEHPAVLEAARLLERDGYRVVFVPALPSGVVDAGELRAAVSRGTALVSLMWANNETGVLQPVPEAVAAAQAAGALSHSDVVQAVGHTPFHFHDSGLDLASVSGHKLGGPVGTGVLLAGRGVKLAPTGGGGGQERGIRSGTVDVAGAAALAAALAEAVATREEESARLAGLRDQIEGAIAAIPGASITGAGSAAAPTTAPAAAPTTGARPAASIRLPRSTPLPSSARLPHITHVIFEGLRAEALLFALDRAGISASAGSACRAGVHQPSHVVLAMGGNEEQASATLRCSLGWTTTQADVDALVGALPTAVDRARAAGATRL